MNNNTDLKLRAKHKIAHRTPWSRIEKKLANSYRTSTSNLSFFNYLRNKTYLKEHHINILNGYQTFTLNGFDPNLVMDIRHKKISCHRKFNVDFEATPFVSSNQSDTTGQEHVVNTFETEQLVKREADKFEKDLQLQRPTAALDFFEYLHSHTKYKYIREKINRYRETRNNESVECDSLIVNDNKFECDSVNGFRRRSASELTERHFNGSARSGGLESPSDDCVDVDERAIDSCCTASNHEEIYQSLKVNLIPKYASEPFELCGIGTNFQAMKLDDTDAVDDNVEQHSVNVEHCTDTSYEKPPYSPLPLNENLRVVKVNIDQLKPVRISYRNNADDYDDIGMAAEEKDALLCEIFCEKKRANFVLLQKYFLKWFHFNTIEKLSKQGAISVNQTRLQKIQKFLQNISIERKMHAQKVKAKKCSTDEKIQAAAKRRDAVEDPVILTKKYNSKLKIQQDIIELQKIKLDRQERIINDLKLTKITDEAKDSQMELKKELRQVIQTGCQPSRSKARCLQIIANLKDAQDDDEYAKLQAKGLSMPKFLIEMQSRALEREMKHQQARERREHLEQDRERQKLAAEEAKRLQDEEGKRQRMEELKQKRREEKLLKIRKEQERQAYIANMKLAEKHHRKKLLKMVLRRFRIAIALKRRAEKRASEFRLNKMRTIILHCWKTHVDNAWHDRKTKADMCHNKQCLRAIMNLWKRYYLVERSKKLIAEDWHDMKISERAFAAWNCITIQSRLVMETKMKQAEAHYTWNLKWRILDHWRRLQVILQIERETEARRSRWRHKIWELLPDYTPNVET